MPVVNYQQNQQMSCAAACLCAAALELGKAPAVPAFIFSPPPAYYNQFVAALNNRHLPFTVPNIGTWEIGIYDISSQDQQWNQESRPQGIVEAAICLGMAPEVRIADRTKLGRRHPLDYPYEEAACNALALNAGTPQVLHLNRTHMGEINLMPNQRAMHCVRNGINRHWVLQRPDNTYMDPADGLTHNSRAALKTTGPYHGTGLAIVLS